jgi:hypothetical protein
MDAMADHGMELPPHYGMLDSEAELFAASASGIRSRFWTDAPYPTAENRIQGLWTPYTRGHNPNIDRGFVLSPRWNISGAPGYLYQPNTTELLSATPVVIDRRGNFRGFMTRFDHFVADNNSEEVEPDQFMVPEHDYTYLDQDAEDRVRLPSDIHGPDRHCRSRPIDGRFHRMPRESVVPMLDSERRFLRVGASGTWDIRDTSRDWGRWSGEGDWFWMRLIHHLPDGRREHEYHKYTWSDGHWWWNGRVHECKLYEQRTEGEYPDGTPGIGS